MSQGPISCEATLRTLCGCQQFLTIPYPPNPVLILPLKRGQFSFKQEPLGEKQQMQTRSFDLLDYYHAGDKFYANYEERRP